MFIPATRSCSACQAREELISEVGGVKDEESWSEDDVSWSDDDVAD
jgi:hypothetical protein